MQRPIFSGIVLVCVFMASTVYSSDKDWIHLFNGEDLTGWTIMNQAEFDVHDGNLRFITGMGWLRTDRLFDDFILEWECKALVDKYDSGIFIRSSLEGNPWPDTSLQINLRYDGLGTLVRGRRAVLKPDLDPISKDEWMKFRLKAEGYNGSLELNGEELWKTDVLDMIELERGLIGIQAENRSFEFRNIRLQPIGYTNLLEGERTNFEHLKVHEGAKDAWRITPDGVLVCQGSGGGWIGTQKGDYSGFILGLDFLVPKEGNSGVFIRHPGKGDGAYAGMEIQLIDNEATHWGKLQDWQMTGSIYHEVTPTADAFKKAGDWQTLQIKADDNRIIIHLNGVEIISTDLDQHTKSTTKALPLKERPREGYIGFQNYDGNMQFRNVWIKRLDN